MGWLTPAQFWPQFSPTRIKLEKRRKPIWSPPMRRIVPGVIVSELVGVQPMSNPVGLAWITSIRDFGLKSFYYVRSDKN